MVNRAKKAAAKALDLLRRGLMRAFCLAPMENIAIFSSFSGKSYCDSPKAIAEALEEIAPDLRIVWLFQHPERKAALLPKGATALRIHSPAALYAMATAKVWVDNMPQQSYITKRRGTIYLQTWHGDRGFKRMLHDAPDHPANRVLSEKKICDAMLSGSSFCEGTYRTGFLYDGEILRFGSPRNDVLLRGDTVRSDAARTALGVGREQKILLYAPTMRNASRRAGQKQPIQPIDIPRTLDKLGAEWVCIVRAHSTQLGLSGLPNDVRIIDASCYEDMADLLLISDMLLTDYSSSAGDFALTGRPIVLFQEDREGFAKTERTFYFDIAQSPYLVATNQAELEAHIDTLTPEAAKQNCAAILQFYGAYETGHAAQSAAEWIQSHRK